MADNVELVTCENCGGVDFEPEHDGEDFILICTGCNSIYKDEEAAR